MQGPVKLRRLEPRHGGVGATGQEIGGGKTAGRNPRAALVEDA